MRQSNEPLISFPKHRTRTVRFGLGQPVNQELLAFVHSLCFLPVIFRAKVTMVGESVQRRNSSSHANNQTG